MLTGTNLPIVKHFYRSSEKKRHKILFIASVIFLTVIKLVAMGIFSSDYQKQMFEPFVCEFLNGLSNPYQVYYDRGDVINFPYPPVMLIAMSVTEAVSMMFSGMPEFIHNILFKLPLLVMDLVVFIKLCGVYSDKKLNVVCLYYASPVVIYSTYMHSQLDIIPMGLLFLSLLYLTGTNVKADYRISALLLSLSLLSKIHIAAIFPIILIYIYKHENAAKAFSYGLAVTAAVIVGILPFYGSGFIDGVLLNKTQSALFALSFSYGSLYLYASLTALMLIYLYVLNLNFINSELLFGLGGLVFSVFLFLCAPMPGWYMWVIIFMADFVIRSNGYRHNTLFFVFLQLQYLIFFLFFHRSGSSVTDLYCMDVDCIFLKIDNPVLKNTSFTILSAVMLYNIIIMHKFCISGNSLYNFHDMSFVIGICGDSGTGKSTLQNNISNMFSSNNFLCLEGDGDHKWERGDSNWNNYTHLDPRANHLYRQAMDIRKLKRGESVKRVDYDHATGHFTSKMTVVPCRFMSISGLHIFYLSQLRDIIDLKIYTEADEELRVFWKLQRDMNSRGHSREEILQQIQARYDDAYKYIYPQKEFADIIIHYYFDDVQTHSVGINISISTKIDVESIIDSLRSTGAVIDYALSEDFRYQIICYRPSENQSINQIDFSELFSELFKDGYDILSRQFCANDPVDAICRLVIVQAIHFKLRGE